MNNSAEVKHFLDVLLTESSFTRAAQKLQISQPYLTQVIKRIEKRLGTPILARTTVPFSLTAAGLIYYQYLVKATEDKQKLRQRLRPFRQHQQKLLRIGISHELATYLLGQLLPSFLKVNGDIAVQLVETSARSNERRLLKNDIDCLLSQQPPLATKKLTSLRNGQEKYYIVIPASTDIYRQGRFILHPGELSIKSLLQRPLLLPSPTTSIRQQIDTLFSSLHLKENILLESDSLITLTNLAVHGLGLTISTPSILKRNDQLPINLLPLSTDLLNSEFFLIIRREQKVSSQLQQFVSVFQKSNLNTNI